MFEKVFDEIKKNLRNPKLYILALSLILVFLLLFPYIDANIFYYNRVNSRIDILEHMTQLDTEKIQENKILEQEYNRILAEIDKQSEGKGGVDFPPVWHKKCRMCVDEETTLELLTELTDELKRRKKLLAAAGQSNIDRYNAATGEQLSRYIFACDEIAEVLDKTGLTKEQKETVSKIESRLSMIARQGRAFGIHLILATQRPDANILSGQIKNNVNCRICGRADTVLSQIILDNTSAAEQIPKDARGRFLIHDGTVFQAYWFDDEGGWK